MEDVLNEIVGGKMFEGTADVELSQGPAPFAVAGEKTMLWDGIQ